MNIALSLSLGGTCQISILIGGDAAARIVTNPDYTLSIDADPTSGLITLVVTVDGTEVGTFVLSEAEYSAPSHNLIPPTISGAGTMGALLTVDPGLWLVDPDLTLSPAYQWMRDGQLIAGATGTSYTVTAADADTVLTCRETLGPNSADSAGLAIHVAPVIASFAVAPTDGSGDERLTLSVTGDSPPTTAHIIGIPAGGAVPTAAQIIAGTDAADGPAGFWLDGHVMTADLANEVLPWTREPADTTASFDFHAVIADSDPAQNVSAPAASLAVAIDTTTGGGYAETGVSPVSGAYIESAALPTDAKSAVAFVSFTTADNGVRQGLLGWGPTFNHGILADWDSTSGDAQFEPRYSMSDTSTGSVLHPMAARADNTRVHILAKVWTDNGGLMHSRLYVAVGSGSLTLVDSNADATSAGAMLSMVILRLFTRPDDSNKWPFTGTVYRTAFWTSQSEAEPPDLLANYADFVSGGVTVDPATSQALLGAMDRQLDLYGDASRYGNATNDGLLAITATGTFI